MQWVARSDFSSRGEFPFKWISPLKTNKVKIMFVGKGTTLIYFLNSQRSRTEAGKSRPNKILKLVIQNRLWTLPQSKYPLLQSSSSELKYASPSRLFKGFWSSFPFLASTSGDKELALPGSEISDMESDEACPREAAVDAWFTFDAEEILGLFGLTSTTFFRKSCCLHV